jgi:fumarylacetoacetate (FAA) hydrolase
MKYVSFKHRDGRQSWGVLNAQGKIFEATSFAPSLLAFIQSDWKSQSARLQAESAKASLAASEVTFLACLPNPTSMRDGYAFRQHVEAARRNRGVPMIPEFDLFPVFYFTNHQAVTGPGPVEVGPLQLDKLDFELESAIVVGKKGRDLKAHQADDYVFGYTIMNVWSARTVQMEEMKMSLGPAKGKDFATSLGAWLVTADELASFKKTGPKGDRYSLEMTCEINGKPISKGNMADMTWTFGEILERASMGTTLYPGDVIGSGTVGTGCFMELNGSGVTNQWLKPGDKVILKISGLGELENTIVFREPGA